MAGFKSKQQKQVIKSIEKNPEDFINVTTGQGGRITKRRDTGEIVAKGFSPDVEIKPRNPESTNRSGDLGRNKQTQVKKKKSTKK